MRGLVAWFAANPVAANLLLMFIVLGGIVTLPGIRREVFPEISVDAVSVTVEYPGAAPAEVESAICIRVEEQIQGVDGIKRVTSTAREGMCTTVAELALHADLRKALDDIETQVDAIDTFPEEAERPDVERIEVTERVMEVALAGPVDEDTLARVGRRVRDEISNLPGITRVDLKNAPDYEISIELSEESMRRHGLTFDAVAAAIRRSSIDLPGGSIKTVAGEVLLRTKGQAYRAADFERIPVIGRPDGTRLLLGDVATVVDGLADSDEWARFNGEPAVVIRVFRVGQQNALEIADAVRAYIDAENPKLPQGLALTAWYDLTKMLRSRMDTLVENGINGFFLVLIVLSLFLRLRVAFWILFGLPLCFLGTLWWMPAFGVSINSNSLFAFILVLGILVDDAIVIGENIFTHHERKGWSLDAAIGGVQEVAVPVVFGVLTTAVAFAPLLLAPGPMGRMFRPIPICVLLALAFSLLESMLILPSHLAHGVDRGASQGRFAFQRGWRRLQERIDRGLRRFIDGVYRSVLETCIEWRYTTAAAALAVLLLCAGLFAGDWLRFAFIPKLGGLHAIAVVELPIGTPARVTSEVLRLVERSGAQAIEQLEAESGEKVARHMFTSVGAIRWGDGRGSLTEQGRNGSHLGEVVIELTSEDERSLAADTVVNRWRQLCGPLAGAELGFTAEIVSAGEPINIALRGENLDDLRRAAERLKAAIATYPGVVDVGDSFQGGKRELQLDILPSAEPLGLTLTDLGRQVRQSFYGEEVQRVQRERDDIKVMLRYPRARRQTLAAVEKMFIRTPDGDEVPFHTVAAVEEGIGFATIARTDRERTVNVVGDVDLEVGNANEVVADLERELLPALAREFPGVEHYLEGEQREQSETLDAMGRGAVLALLAIYALLAVPLRSYSQPLLIMLAIPFGLIGAVAGHLLLGSILSMSSLMGMVALAGVVVNDSLVLVSYVNQNRAAGVPVARAIRDAGAARFRPILLTSLTTFAGLVPILADTGYDAALLRPMAISLAFGVLLATAVTLLLVPAAYAILEDWQADSRSCPTTDADAELRHSLRSQASSFAGASEDEQARA
jgi:multidrug efflux pump subunit AcrB